MGQKQLTKSNLRFTSKDLAGKNYAVSLNNVDQDASVADVETVKNALQEVIQDDISVTALNLTYEFTV